MQGVPLKRGDCAALMVNPLDLIKLVISNYLKQVYWPYSVPEKANTGSLEKCGCGNISAKLYYVASFIVKCPMSGATTEACESANVLLLWLLYISRQFRNEMSGN